MEPKANTKSLYIISLVAIVNALGYGIIIPLLYSYGKKFGISNIESGVLFAAFSVAQFIATPIIGRLSDQYGRKPMLVYSTIGTAISFLLFAIAQNPLMLYVARILDGVSGGNISVAQAVISDLTTPKERAKWFGMLGASFGFGFVFGPAIGGFLSLYNERAPFWLAMIVSLICAVLVQFMLKESVDKKHVKPQSLVSAFNLKKLVQALFEPFVGLVLSASFLASLAFMIFVLGFQSYTADVLLLPPSQISLLFVVFGVIGLIMQGFVVGKVARRMSDVNLLFMGVTITAIGFALMGASNTFLSFVGASAVVAVGNAFLQPMISSLLSKHTKKEDQGGIMGINQAYVSLASIAGPIVGGYLTTVTDHAAFFGASGALVLTLLLTFVISREHGKHVVDL